MGEATADLTRFVTAQEPVYATVLHELRAGRKRTHWMWFVFPQLAGLGHSSMAQRFAIRSLEEARAYLAHPHLGDRFSAALAAVQASPAPSIVTLFGSPDDLKFHSSVSLFALADPAGPAQAALDRWYGGALDAATAQGLNRVPMRT